MEHFQRGNALYSLLTVSPGSPIGPGSPCIHTHKERAMQLELKFACMVKSLFGWMCCCLHQVQGLLWVLSLLARPPDLVPPAAEKQFSVEVTHFSA